jgi:translation initiation factor IF-3
MATRERSRENRILSNREIRARDVRLIAEDGANLGIWPFFKALDRARDDSLDLILINPTSNPPICKLGDLGKYKYDLQKKAAEASKRARETRIDIKEVQLRPNIDTHDLLTKLKHIKEWLEDGDKVKIVIKFRGREMANKEAGFSVLNDVLVEVPNAKLESKDMQGNRLTAVLFQGKQNVKEQQK